MNLRSMRAAALAAAAVSAVSCSGEDGGPAPHRCAADPDCGAGAWCVRGACVADTPPVPEMTVPSSLRSNVEVELTAAVSDADPRDSVQTLAWAIATVSGCEPDVASSSDPTLRTIFWCPGTYRIELVAVDRAGVEGRTSRVVEVAPSPGAPSAAAAPDVAAGHLCGGEPLSCVVLPASGQGSIQLSATATDPEGGPLAFEWIPVAPAGVEATVSFEPDASSPQPLVHIATAGGAISGTWRFKARVRDAQGLLGQAIQVIEVSNLAPTIVTTAIEVPHRYVAPSFVVDAPLEPVVEDPEGDPVVFALEYAEAPAGACTTRIARPDAAAPRLQTSCGDPAALIGGVERALTITAIDANGAASAQTVPVRILNGAPVVSLADGRPPLLPHSVADCPEGRCFVASGSNPFVVTDPDGDPVAPIALEVTVPGRSTAVAEAGPDDAGGWYRVRVPLAYPLDFLPKPLSGAQRFALVGTARDPWEPASATTPIIIVDRAPVLRSPQPAHLAPHRYEAAARSFFAEGPAAAYDDPDGDPITFTGSWGTGCTGAGDATGVVQATCRASYDWTSADPNPLASFVGTHDFTVVASDPWASTTTPTSFTVANATPAAISDPVVVDSCMCTCSKFDLAGNCVASTQQWAAATATIAFAADADADPLSVSISSSSTSASVAPTLRCLGGSCTAPVRVTSPGSYTLTATPADGVDTGISRWRTVVARCSTAGSACEF